VSSVVSLAPLGCREPVGEEKRETTENTEEKNETLLGAFPKSRKVT